MSKLFTAVCLFAVALLALSTHPAQASATLTGSITSFTVTKNDAPWIDSPWHDDVSMGFSISNINAAASDWDQIGAGFTVYQILDAAYSSDDDGATWFPLDISPVQIAHHDVIAHSFSLYIAQYGGNTQTSSPTLTIAGPFDQWYTDMGFSSGSGYRYKFEYHYYVALIMQEYTWPTLNSHHVDSSDVNVTRSPQ